MTVELGAERLMRFNESIDLGLEPADAVRDVVDAHNRLPDGPRLLGFRHIGARDIRLLLRLLIHRLEILTQVSLRCLRLLGIEKILRGLGEGASEIERAKVVHEITIPATEHRSHGFRESE